MSNIQKYCQGATIGDESAVSSNHSKFISTKVECSAEASLRLGRRCHGSKHRGVIFQPNGRWGAQIYENNQRIWLGTYASEDKAAEAYEIAARCLRGSGRNPTVLNFIGGEKGVNEDYAAETELLRTHSKLEIVEMLRTHTYDDELEQMKNSIRYTAAGGRGGPPHRVLFQKTMTPSDVGRQNRLVIPKKYAEKHFVPHMGIESSSEELDAVTLMQPTRTPSENNSTIATAKTATKGVHMLNFRDANGGKVWRFRFSYWHRSRSYVLTRGWSRFVKEKSLKAGDMVSFLQSTGPNKRHYIHFSKPIARSPETALRLFGVDIIAGGSWTVAHDREVIHSLFIKNSVNEPRVAGSFRPLERIEAAISLEHRHPL
ncbi:hypothetical protein SAY86_002119 [Trapa natans]|uniref:Uncharacterized protein n=1 Tax=Trapa natans TaxID=22666 RepID=A0AAN7LHA9_TRANT|nr:hypothetical protein SAY86_002119 [Trapa natans]